MSLSLFDFLAEICQHKSDLDFDDPEISKEYDIFMINRYMSMIEYLIMPIDAVNRPGMDKRDHYNFLRTVIPKNPYKFAYIKKVVDKDREEDLRYICHHFEIGMREAKLYIEHLKPKQIEDLKKIYRHGKNGKESLQFK